MTNNLEHFVNIEDVKKFDSRIHLRMTLSLRPSTKFLNLRFSGTFVLRKLMNQRNMIVFTTHQWLHETATIKATRARNNPSPQQ